MVPECRRWGCSNLSAWEGGWLRADNGGWSILLRFNLTLLHILGPISLPTTTTTSGCVPFALGYTRRSRPACSREPRKTLDLAIRPAKFSRREKTRRRRRQGKERKRLRRRERKSRGRIFHNRAYPSAFASGDNLSSSHFLSANVFPACSCSSQEAFYVSIEKKISNSTKGG